MLFCEFVKFHSNHPEVLHRENERAETQGGVILRNDKLTSATLPFVPFDNFRCAVLRYCFENNTRPPKCATIILISLSLPCISLTLATKVMNIFASGSTLPANPYHLPEIMLNKVITRDNARHVTKFTNGNEDTSIQVYTV